MATTISARLADGWRARVDPAWLEGWEPQWFELGDGAIEVVVTGGGPTVVLLPGLPGYKEMWLPLATRLRRRFRIVTFDLRVAGGPARWELALGDLERVADAFVPEPAVVIGHSLGGALAQRWALARPERVRALVLSSSFARVGSLRGQWRKRVFEQLVVLASQRLLPEALAAPLARRLAAREAWVYDDRCDERTLAFVRHGIRTVSPRLARACLGLAFAHDTRAELSRVGVPTLVVVGERETPWARSAAVGLAAAIPGAVLEVAPGVAHLHPLSAPDWLAATVTDWLEVENRCAAR